MPLGLQLRCATNVTFTDWHTEAIQVFHSPPKSFVCLGWVYFRVGWRVGWWSSNKKLFLHCVHSFCKMSTYMNKLLSNFVIILWKHVSLFTLPIDLRWLRMWLAGVVGMWFEVTMLDKKRADIMMSDRCKLMIHPVLSEHAFKYISNVPTFYTAAVTWKRSLTQHDEHNAEWLSKCLPLCESAGHSEHDVKSKERLLHRAACTLQPAKPLCYKGLINVLNLKIHDQISSKENVAILLAFICTQHHK